VASLYNFSADASDPELENEEIHRSYFVTDEVTSPSNWKKSLAINAVGELATFVVLCVFERPISPRALATKGTRSTNKERLIFLCFLCLFVANWLDSQQFNARLFI